MLIPVKAIKVEMASRAQRDLKQVPSYIVFKLFAWIKAVKLEGLAFVRRIPGYHDEPLKGYRLGQRSIRLNRSYRAIYEIIDGDPIIIQVQEVTKHDY